MRRYRTAHLGLGGRGRRYIKPFQESERYELVGICDMDAERLTSAQQEFSIDESQCYEDCAKMLDECKPEIFSFVTPPAIRLPLVQQAADAGVEGIIFEKPAANTLAELRQIAAVCEEKQIKAIVCHQHKYADQYKQIKRYLSERAGRVHEINIMCTIPKHITQVVTHGLDLLLWLNDYAKPEWVAGHMNGADGTEEPFPGARYIAGRVKFANGVYAFVEAGADGALYWSGDAKADITVTVTAQKGDCSACGAGPWRILDETDGGSEGKEEDILKIMHYELQVPFIADFARWMDDEEAAHSSCVANALIGQEILEAIYKSAETMQRVALPVPADDPGDRALRLREIIPSLATEA